MKKKNYNDTILSYGYATQIERRYTLDCANDIIRYYEEQNKNQNCMNTEGESLVNFCNKIRKGIKNGTIHFAYFDGKSLIIKYKNYNQFYKDTFTLNANAKNSNTLMSFFNELPNIQPTYEELLSSENYTDTLVSTYYKDLPLIFEEQRSLDEFTKFYQSKKSLLAKNKYNDYNNIRKKLSNYIVNLLFLFFIDAIVLMTVGGWDINFIAQIIIKVAALFGKEYATEGIFRIVSIKEVEETVKKAISANQSLISSKTFEKNQVPLTHELEKNTEKDQIVYEILDFISKIKKTKYEGYQKHLSILNKILELHLKTQKLNLGALNSAIAVDYPRLLLALNEVEEQIDTSIEKSSKYDTNDEETKEFNPPKTLKLEL